MRKAGRPEKKIDIEELVRLKSEGRSWRAIGGALGISKDTARKAWAEHLAKTAEAPAEVTA